MGKLNMLIPLKCSVLLVSTQLCLNKKNIKWQCCSVLAWLVTDAACPIWRVKNGHHLLGDNTLQGVCKLTLKMLQINPTNESIPCSSVTPSSRKRGLMILPWILSWKHFFFGKQSNFFESLPYSTLLYNNFLLHSLARLLVNPKKKFERLCSKFRRGALS